MLVISVKEKMSNGIWKIWSVTWERADRGINEGQSR